MSFGRTAVAWRQVAVFCCVVTLTAVGLALWKQASNHCVVRSPMFSDKGAADLPLFLILASLCMVSAFYRPAQADAADRAIASGAYKIPLFSKFFLTVEHLIFYLPLFSICAISLAIPVVSLFLLYLSNTACL